MTSKPKRICIKVDNLTDDEVSELKDTINQFGEEVRSRREETQSESDEEEDLDET